MYKLFAVLLFSTASLVLASALAPGDDNFFDKISTFTFLFTILVFAAFFVFLIIDSIFVIRRKTFSKLPDFSARFKRPGVITVIANILYFLTVLSLSAVVFFVMGYFTFFSMFRESSVVMSAFFNEGLKNTELSSNVIRLLDTSERNQSEIKSDLELLQNQLHAQAETEFFNYNPTFMVADNGTYRARAEYVSKTENTMDLNNSYNYKLSLCNLSALEDAFNNWCIYVPEINNVDPLEIALNQDTALQALQLNTIEDSVFIDNPIFVVTLTTDNGEHTYLLYPKEVYDSERTGPRTYVIGARNFHNFNINDVTVKEVKEDGVIVIINAGATPYGNTEKTENYYYVMENGLVNASVDYGYEDY